MPILPVHEADSYFRSVRELRRYKEVTKSSPKLFRWLEQVKRGKLRFFILRLLCHVNLPPPDSP